MKVQATQNAKLHERKTRRFRASFILLLINSLTLPLFQIPASAAEPASTKDIQATLRFRKDFHLDGVPLNEFVADLSKQLGFRIRLDQEGLQRAKVAEGAPVVAHFRDLTVNRALLRVLDGLGLRHAIREGEVVITNAPPKQVPDRLVPRLIGRRRPLDAAQFAGELRPLLALELGYVKRVCEPTDAQMRGLDEDGEQILKIVAERYVAGGGRRFVPMEGPVPVDARAEICESLMLAVESRLPDDRFRRYAEETRLRAEHRKRAAVQNLVVRLDEHLLLSAEQRETISNVLSGNGSYDWSLAAPESGSFLALPLLPHDFIVPHLTKQQQMVWETTPKTNGMPARVNWDRINRANARRHVREN